MSTLNPHNPVTPVCDERTGLARLIDAYAAELADRRTQLLRDLGVYRRKLSNLVALDPLDVTGLGRLYREHVRHIEHLLDQLAASAA